MAPICFIVPIQIDDDDMSRQVDKKVSFFTRISKLESVPGLNKNILIQGYNRLTALKAIISTYLEASKRSNL